MTAGDLLVRAVDLAMQHGMSCTAEECPHCDAGFNQIRLAYKVWANSTHKSTSAACDPVDTYTPMLWATLNEGEKYIEYVRVRQIASGTAPAYTSLAQSDRKHHE